MIFINYFLMLFIMGIDGQRQYKSVTELAGFVGVKVPNERIQISSWITDDEGLIVEAQPNNEMYTGKEEKFHISAKPNYIGKVDFHFLSKNSAVLAFTVQKDGHDLKQTIDSCKMDLEASIGETCYIETFKELWIEWDIACSDLPLKPAPPKQTGFILEHTGSDRWIITGMDKELEQRGYSSNYILHVNFGPTQSDFCHFKVIINSQNAEDGSASNKDNRDNILLLSREKVPEEMREEFFYDPDYTTPSTTSTPFSTSALFTMTITLPTKNGRWTFPPKNKVVFGFMKN